MEGTSASGAAPQAEASAAQQPATTEQSQEQKPTNRQRLVERYAKQFPDKKFDGDGADEELYGLALGDFDKFEKDKASYTERNERLNKLFKDVPESAELFRAMAKDKVHPFDYMIDHYGDRLREALDSDEGKAKLKEHRAAKAKRDADDAEADKAFDANMAKSLEALERFGKKRGLDGPTQAAHFQRVRQAVLDALDGNISEETYDIFFNGGRYDEDIARAREEGEINGRNAKIGNEIRRSESAKRNPPTLSGQGLSESESEPNKGEARLAMFDIPIKKINK